MKTSWAQELEKVLASNNETLTDIVKNTMTEEEMHTQFNAGYGLINGCPFTVWTKNFVYFPATYDGSEWVAFVSRKPNNKPTQHIGG